MTMLRTLSYALAALGSFIALLLGLMTAVSVVGRYFFSKPIPGDVELVQMGIAFAISLCIPWCQYRGANIIVDFFTQKTLPRGRRMLDALGCVLLAVMYFLLSWRTAAGAISVKAAGETSMIMGLPMWWAYAALAPGLAVAGVIALAQAAQLARNRDLPELDGAAA